MATTLSFHNSSLETFGWRRYYVHVLYSLYLHDNTTINKSIPQTNDFPQRKILITHFHVKEKSKDAAAEHADTYHLPGLPHCDNTETD